MDSIENLIIESQSGPELYIAMTGRSLSLGSLLHVLDTVNHAIDGARLFIEKMDAASAGCEERSQFVSLRIILEYVLNCLVEIHPEAAAGGQTYRYDDTHGSKKIVMDETTSKFTAPKTSRGGQKQGE